MSDIEKVIKGLEHCVGYSNSCFECPYSEDGYSASVHCKVQVDRDALAILKEQEETEWEHLWNAPDGTFKGRCKKCGFVHFFIEGHDTQYKFCPECGRSVK